MKRKPILLLALLASLSLSGCDFGEILSKFNPQTQDIIDTEDDHDDDGDNTGGEDDGGNTGGEDDDGGNTGGEDDDGGNTGGDDDGGNTGGDDDHEDHADEISPVFAMSLMDAAGDGHVYPELVKVAGICASGTTLSKYGEYTTGFEGVQNFKVLFKDPDNLLNGSMPDGKVIVVEGYLELYNGAYQLAYLPEAASPTGQKFTPTLVRLEDNGTGGGGGGEEHHDATLQSISVSSNNREFNKGSQFAPETVIAHYSDGSSSVVNATFTGYNTSNPGTQTVTVSYTDGVTVTTTYTITVLDQQVVVTTESSKYLFTNTATSDNGTDLTDEALKGKFASGITSGQTDIVSSVSGTTKVYDGKDSTLKMSSSKANGSFTLNLSKTVNQVIINASQYGTNTDGSLKVNNGEAKAPEASFGDLTFDISASSSVTITATKRSYIKSIELISSSGGGGGTTTQKTLSSITISGQRTVYSVGDSFAFTGTCTAHYSDGTVAQVTPTSVSTPTMSTAGNKTVTVTYTINGVSKTATYTITVSESSGGGGGGVDTNGYYDGITETSTSLLADLRSLNSRKRTKTVGYSNMLNKPENGFYVTDPGTGSNTITTFYSGNNNNGTGGLNREHVWPDSRGGNYVEADIHMPRPTLSAENGSRGNSFYVEGKCKSSGGWDPAMESFGKESYRGDSARIIFYCVVASNNLSLVDKEDDSTGNHTMGKLSDLLRWNLQYPVLQREQTRNDGAQKLQGNRNPFIDHPEYACRIWGNTNDTTRQICGIK